MLNTLAISNYRLLRNLIVPLSALMPDTPGAPNFGAPVLDSTRLVNLTPRLPHRRMRSLAAGGRPDSTSAISLPPATSASQLQKLTVELNVTQSISW
jgi:hypothetical protein